MDIRAYVKNHPITYKSLAIPFVVTFIFATLLWIFIILDVGAEYFGDMLLQQAALKWVWLFASISLLFITVKVYRFGSIDDYDDKYTKWLGIYFGNAALSMAAAYAALMWAALIPVMVFDQLLPEGVTLLELFKACVYFLGLTVFLYLFYLSMFVNADLNKYYGSFRHTKIMRPLLLVFAICFCLGRILDVVKIFKPELF
jgi:hypothetical protein